MSLTLRFKMAAQLIFFPAQKKKLAAQEIYNGCAGKKINCAAIFAYLLRGKK